MTAQTNQSAAIAAIVAFLVVPNQLRSVQRQATEAVRAQTTNPIVVQRTLAKTYSDLDTE